MDRLYRIEQSPGESVPNYIAKFKRLLYEAKGHNQDDDRKISAFRFRLNSTIKNRLAQQLELPSTYPKFLQAVQKLSSRSGTTPSGSTNALQQHVPRPSNSANLSNRNSDPIDLSQLDVNLNALDFYKIDHNGNATRIRHPDPVRLRQETSKRQGLDLNNIKFNSSIRGLKPSEIRPSSPCQSYKETGACLRCGSFEHWLAHCPKLARPTQNS